MDDMDKEVERILNMTEAELRAEVAADGLDWDEEIAKCKSCFELAVADVEFERWQRGLPPIKPRTVT